MVMACTAQFFIMSGCMELHKITQQSLISPDALPLPFLFALVTMGNLGSI